MHLPINPKFLILLVAAAICSIVLGCGSSSSGPNSEAVDNVHRSLDRAGYEDVVVRPTHGVLVLDGTVASEGDKAHVQFLAKENAGPFVVSNYVSVHSPADTIQAKVVTQVEEENSNYSVVRIFYATDRKLSGFQPPIANYTGDRSDDDALSFGTLDVSIPQNHHVGELERPSILRFEVREDPEKHVVVLKVALKSEAQFYSEVSSRVGSSAGKEAFVFIHGYDVSFLDAARRTAQIAYDLGFDGAPILYSWPSKGEILSYPADEATIEWTAPHLKQFLEKLALKSHATTINLIAHSMGNRALTNALNSIATEHSGTPMFNEVLMAAPDIDVGVFKQLAAIFPKPATHVTLYSSSKDEALIASKKYHQYRRAGDSSPVVILPGIDTIDATAVDTGFGHSYYADNRAILADIHTLLRSYDPPSKRFGMRPNKPQNPTYWIFNP